MHLTAQAVRTAITNRLGASIAERVTIPDEGVEDDGLADLLGAVVGGPSALAAELAYVILFATAEADVVTLSAAEAIEHPLLAPFVAESLAEAIAAPILAGTRLTGLANGAPHWAEIAVSDRGDGVFSGVATFSFGEHLQVSAFYGQQHEVPIITTVRLHGGALVYLGLDARRLSTGEPESPSRRAEEIAAARRRVH